MVVDKALRLQFLKEMSLNASDGNVTEVSKRVGRNKNFGYDTLEFFGKVYVRQQMLHGDNAALKICEFFNADQNPDSHLSVEDINELANVSDKYIVYYKDMVDQRRRQGKDNAPPIMQPVADASPTQQVFEDQETFFSRNSPDESQRGFEEKPMSYHQPAATKVPQSFDTHTQLLRMVLENTKQVSPITIDKIANMFELNMSEYQNPYQLYMLFRAFLSPQQADQAFNSFIMAAPKYVVNPLTGAPIMQPGMPSNMPTASNGTVNWNMYGQAVQQGPGMNPYGPGGIGGQMPYTGMSPNGVPVAGIPGFPMPTDPRFAQEMLKEELEDKRRRREREELNDQMNRQMAMSSQMMMQRMAEGGGGGMGGMMMGGMGMNPMMGMGIEEQYDANGKVVARRSVPITAMNQGGNTQELVMKMFGDLNNNLMAKVLNPDSASSSKDFKDIAMAFITRQQPDPWDQIVKMKQVMGNGGIGGGQGFLGQSQTPEMLRMQADIQLALEDQWMRFRERERDYEMQREERAMEDKKMAVWVDTFKEVANNSFGPAINQIAQGFASGITAKQQGAAAVQQQMALRQAQERQIVQQGITRPQPQERQQTIEQRAMQEGEIERRKQEQVLAFQRQLAAERADRMSEGLEVENLNQNVTPQEYYAAQQRAQAQRRMPVQQQQQPEPEPVYQQSQNPMPGGPAAQANPYSPGVMNIPSPAGAIPREGDEEPESLPPLGPGGIPLEGVQQPQPQPMQQSFGDAAPGVQPGQQGPPQYQEEQPMSPEEQLMAMRQAPRADLDFAKSEAIKRMISLKSFVDDIDGEEKRREQIIGQATAARQNVINRQQQINQREAANRAEFNAQAAQLEAEMGVGVEPVVQAPAAAPAPAPQELPVQPQDRAAQQQAARYPTQTGTIPLGSGIGIGGLARDQTEEEQRLQELAEIEGRRLQAEATAQAAQQSQPPQVVEASQQSAAAAVPAAVEQPTVSHPQQRPKKKANTNTKSRSSRAAATSQQESMAPPDE